MTLWGVACHKLGSIVTENELAILDMDHHIRLAVMMHVTEGESDGYEVIPLSHHAGADVIVRFGRVAAGQLNHNDLSMQVQCHKMTGVRRAIVVSNYRICLGVQWIAVHDIIVSSNPPCQERGKR